MKKRYIFNLLPSQLQIWRAGTQHLFESAPANLSIAQDMNGRYDKSEAGYIGEFRNGKFRALMRYLGDDEGGKLNRLCDALPSPAATPEAFHNLYKRATTQQAMDGMLVPGFEDEGHVGLREAFVLPPLNVIIGLKTIGRYGSGDKKQLRSTIISNLDKGVSIKGQAGTGSSTLLRLISSWAREDGWWVHEGNMPPESLGRIWACDHSNKVSIGPNNNKSNRLSVTVQSPDLKWLRAFRDQASELFGHWKRKLMNLTDEDLQSILVDCPNGGPEELGWLLRDRLDEIDRNNNGVDTWVRAALRRTDDDRSLAGLKEWALDLIEHALCSWGSPDLHAFVDELAQNQIEKVIATVQATEEQRHLLKSFLPHATGGEALDTLKRADLVQGDRIRGLRVLRFALAERALRKPALLDALLIGQHTEVIERIAEKPQGRETLLDRISQLPIQALRMVLLAPTPWLESLFTEPTTEEMAAKLVIATDRRYELPKKLDPLPSIEIIQQLNGYDEPTARFKRCLAMPNVGDLRHLSTWQMIERDIHISSAPGSWWRLAKSDSKTLLKLLENFTELGWGKEKEELIDWLCDCDDEAAVNFVVTDTATSLRPIFIERTVEKLGLLPKLRETLVEILESDKQSLIYYGKCWNRLADSATEEELERWLFSESYPSRWSNLVGGLSLSTVKGYLTRLEKKPEIHLQDGPHSCVVRALWGMASPKELRQCGLLGDTCSEHLMDNSTLREDLREEVWRLHKGFSVDDVVWQLLKIKGVPDDFQQRYERTQRIDKDRLEEALKAPLEELSPENWLTLAKAALKHKLSPDTCLNILDGLPPLGMLNRELWEYLLKEDPIKTRKTLIQRLKERPDSVAFAGLEGVLVEAKVSVNEIKSALDKELATEPFAVFGFITALLYLGETIEPYLNSERYGAEALTALTKSDNCENEILRLLKENNVSLTHLRTLIVIAFREVGSLFSENRDVVFEAHIQKIDDATSSWAMPERAKFWILAAEIKPRAKLLERAAWWSLRTQDAVD